MGQGMTRNELLHFAKWLLKDEFGEGREEQIVDTYLAEIEQPRISDTPNRRPNP